MASASLPIDATPDEEGSQGGQAIERDLSASFESDPETGANVIRQWISQAA